jgi:plasmid maintenance system antidote protein VapI
MPSIEFITGEIDRMRNRVNRQRREILLLRHAGISTTSAAAVLDAMLKKVNDLCTERKRLTREQFRLLTEA